MLQLSLPFMSAIPRGDKMEDDLEFIDPVVENLIQLVKDDPSLVYTLSEDQARLLKDAVKDMVLPGNLFAQIDAMIPKEIVLADTVESDED